MTTLGWIILTLVAAIIVAALREPAEAVVHAVLGLPARIVDVARRGASAAAEAIDDVAMRTLSGLAYGPRDTTAAALWDVLAPLVYVALFALIAAGDLVLAGLRFGAMLGIPVTHLPVTGVALDLLAGVLFLAVLTTFGCVLLDILHITPMRRPFGLIAGRTRKAVLSVAVAGTALTVISAVLFFVWGQEALTGAPDDDVAMLFIAVFAVTLVGASILAAGGAVAAVPALWVLAAGLLATTLRIVTWVLHALGSALDGAHRLVVAVIRLVTKPGALLWNWMASLARFAQLGQLREPDPVESLVAPSYPLVEERRRLSA